jgi:hypothetical protein
MQTHTCHHAIHDCVSDQHVTRRLAVSDFVQAWGTKFVAGGLCFFFQGTNAYYMGPAHLDDVSDDDIRDHVGVHASKGIKVMRVWGFGNRNGGISTNDEDGTFTLSDR